MDSTFSSFLFFVGLSLISRAQQEGLEVAGWVDVKAFFLLARKLAADRRSPIYLSVRLSMRSLILAPESMRLLSELPVHTPKQRTVKTE